MTNQARFKKTLDRQPADRILTYDVMDNREVLVRYGGLDLSRSYAFEELVEVNARALQAIGLDITRNVYDPFSHWMGAKIRNWIRFFGVDPANWEVSEAGETAWISKRPFTDLRGLERNLPRLPVFEEVEEWYRPTLRYIQEVYEAHDLVFIGGLEGPICDAYTYTDTELFCTAIYDAPELISHIMDCTGLFSACLARVFAENTTAPLLFMGEDIAGKTGPIFSPSFIREHGLPRWNRIAGPLREKGMKFLFHTDGRYGELLPIILREFGADGLNPIERNGCNDIFQIHREYPDTLLFGNVCCAATLPYGTPEDVEDETLEIIEHIGPDGGILIGSSSEVHDLVPVENAVAMYRAVHEYGGFPIDIERIRERRKAISSLRERHKGAPCPS
ncbi:MAG: uroporphyrinogen decarboxylase family protein [Candidatus Latescibacterota bacterium]